MFRRSGSREGNSRFEMDMCSGSVLKKLLIFAVPLIFSSVLQLLFNAADVVIVGNAAGDTALAAVGSTTPLINLLTNIFIGISVGTNVLVARNFAAGSRPDVHQTVHTSILLSLFSGIFLTIVGVFLAPQILKLMKVPDSVIGPSSLYLRIYFIGITATLLYNFGSAILRAVGDTKRPLIFLVISGIVNVSLNVLFVTLAKIRSGNEEVISDATVNQCVGGVAIATAVSQCVSALLVIMCLVREKGFIRLELRKLRIYKDKLWQILRIGLPAGFQGALFSLSNVVIQSAINSFGKVTMAGSVAANNIEGFVYVTMNAFHQAAISFTGQNIGAKKYERINRIAYTSVLCVIVVGVVAGVGMSFILGRPLLGLYTDQPAVVEQGLIRLKCICAFYFLCGIMDVLVGVLRGLGYSIMPMIVSLVGVCGFRILWIKTVFRIPECHTIETVYLSYLVTWTLTALIHFICFLIVRRRKKAIWGV
ncbi:MAG: MATE family efflux transporter [Ruminococcaceae bacterium]|nr:MATE family efflux transporter [Oscillospiraceae bacterium]